MGNTKQVDTHLVEMEPHSKTPLYTSKMICSWTVCITFVVALLAAVLSLVVYQNRELSNRVEYLEAELHRIDNILDILQTRENEEAETDVVKTRRKRELPTEAHVVEGSYLSDDASTPSEGLRLYERWQDSGNQREPLSQQITVEETVPLPLPNYTSVTFTPRKRRKNTEVSSRNTVAVIERRSRVKQTDTLPPTNAPLVHPASWEILTGYNGTTLSPEITHLPSNTTRRRRRRKHRRPKIKQLRSRHEEDNFIDDSLSERDLRREFVSSATTAALYHADGDQAQGGSHRLGNFRVRNRERKFSHLKHAGWMNMLGLSTDYKLRNGDIVITRPGLYYIFAQVQYSDMRDLNGFQIDVNEQPLTNCVTMTTTQPGNMIKSNTCFTATLAYLNGRDHVGLRDLDHHRISLQKEGHTYVGLIWLMDN